MTSVPGVVGSGVLWPLQTDEARTEGWMDAQRSAGVRDHSSRTSLHDASAWELGRQHERSASVGAERAQRQAAAAAARCCWQQGQAADVLKRLTDSFSA